jgi:integrase
MARQLTDTECRSAKCVNKDGEPVSIRKLSAGGGLYLWITPDGARRWRFRYTVMGIRKGTGPDAGKPGMVEKLISVGTFPTVKLADARDKVTELRKLADPSATRKAVKKAETVAASNDFESVARAWLAKQKHWGEKYSRDVLARLQTYVFPHIGAHSIGQISRGQLADVLESVEAQGSAALAHRLMPIMSSIYRYALAKGLCDHNPLGDFKLKDLSILKPDSVKQPAVTAEELPALLRKIDTVKNTQLRLAAKLIFLLFVRSNEMLMGTWDEIDLENALWRIPANRMKKRLPLLVPLSAQAVKILRELKEIGHDSEFVFPGRSYEKPLSSKALLEVFLNLGYGGIQTTHGVRRLASTALNDAEDEGRPLFHADAIERQLAHVKESVRETYNEAEYLPQRRKIMTYWSDYLDAKAKEGLV